MSRRSCQYWCDSNVCDLIRYWRWCSVAVPISAGIECALSLGKKVLHKITINKKSKYKKQYEKDQQTNESFDNSYKKRL